MYFTPSFWLYPYQFYKGYFDFLDSTKRLTLLDLGYPPARIEGLCPTIRIKYENRNERAQ